MISTESFSKEWIIRRSEELGYKNKQLIEKVIRAFALLEMLVDAGAPVLFKGGSSLMLILKDTLNRLSIDVDVICPPGTEIRAYLKNLEEHGFVNIVPIRTEHGGKDLPASHFRSFYEVAFGGGDDDEAFIRLDVLYEENPYNKTQLLPIDSPFLIQQGESLKVRVPSKEDILGDKLTAFGPDTLAAFRKVSAVELGYRNMAGQIDRYFEDVRQSAMCLSTRGQIGEGRFDEFRDGLIRIKGYMYQRNYYIEHATVDAAKAACLATSFQRGVTDIPKYSQEANLSELTIFDKMPKELQRLRRSLPEAFWYWARTYELL